MFVAAAHPTVPDGEVVDVVWDGSSGLYTAQVALMALGARGAILCGIPMDQDAGHIHWPGDWSNPGPYRAGFRQALPEIGGRLRSMSGWTRSVFGEPTPEWLAALALINPMGRRGPQPERPVPMNRVRNTSDTQQSFNGRDAAGNLRTFHVAPGETSEPVTVNERSPAFKRGLEVIAHRPRPPADAAKKKAAPKKKTPAKRKAAPAPAAPPTPPAAPPSFVSGEPATQPEA